ncbi:hypothetical protein PC9H_010400 [Pleurotus ostreatus]|uniref:Uncharacterized protein n=1 Tax=Pleurotus ostreatus TaxID=5322 RepID=A0A8H6ZMQ7_PLEOS|nr:uncharacterized protein PC9H_010400 [Pleurotus ostreatus]KAF7422244.1 hypothetical protein PC9H_010400 [Pleurotus ostreatus]KAJ8691959.1 hypothetical protein PTI98_011475 [Pleurotus ostreatus]
MDISSQVKVPVDRTTIRNWLDTRDGIYFSLTVDEILEHGDPSAYEIVLKRKLEKAPKAICDTILGPDRNRVLANIADLRAKKGLNLEDLTLQLFVDSYRH